MSNSNQLVRSLNIPGITSILNLPLFPVPYIYCHEREHVLAGHMYTLQLSGGHTSIAARLHARRAFCQHLGYTPTPDLGPWFRVASKLIMSDAGSYERDWT